MQVPEGWPERPQRLVIVGCSGAGKSTLALRLGHLLDVPAVDLDTLHWLPNWQGRSDADFRKRVAEVVAQDSWVIAGNYQRVQDLIWPRAQGVIWLDISLLKALTRVSRRSVVRAWRKEWICNGNQESLRQTFASRDSLLLWLFRTHGSHRARYRARLQTPELGPPILRLRRSADVDAWCEQVWLAQRHWIFR
ncbi:MAG: hypothetical protein ACO1RX_13380 [Candidatus Sericytochromatia bacterium]